MGRLKTFFAGAAFALSGFRMWARKPGTMMLGVIPPLVVGAVLITAWCFLAVFSPEIATAMTPFAQSWDDFWMHALRTVIAVALVAAGVVLGVLMFAALTLMVGAPIYEQIWRVTEQEFGGVPGEVELSVRESIVKGIGDGARLLGISIVTGVLVAIIGLIPGVGTVLGAVCGALFGGFALATELTGMAADARGIALRDRSKLLQRSRTFTLGFGVAVYLLFLIPGFAVAAMPAMTVSGTLLLRKLAGEPSSLANPRV